MSKTFEYLGYYDVYGAILDGQGTREVDEQGTQVPARNIGDHPQANFHDKSTIDAIVEGMDEKESIPDDQSEIHIFDVVANTSEWDNNWVTTMVGLAMATATPWTCGGFEPAIVDKTRKWMLDSGSSYHVMDTKNVNYPKERIT